MTRGDIAGLLRDEPLVLEGWAPALEIVRRFDVSRLVERHGARAVRVEHGTFLRRGLAQSASTLRHVLEAVAGADEEHVHIAQCNLDDDLPGLARELAVETMRPTRWCSSPLLWIASAGTTTPTHADHAHNLNLQVTGEKRIRLAEPSASRWLGRRARVKHFAAVDLADVPHLGAEIVLRHGQLLYIPMGWWHRFESLGPTVNLSIFFRRSHELLRCLLRGGLHRERRYPSDVRFTFLRSRRFVG